MTRSSVLLMLAGTPQVYKVQLLNINGENTKRLFRNQWDSSPLDRVRKLRIVIFIFFFLCGVCGMRFVIIGL